MKLNAAQLIGIHGPLNGGKDTVANLLQELNPGKHRRYAFARPLKEACKALFGFSDMQLEDRVMKEAVDEFWGFTPRKAMQLLGTEFGRVMLRDDVWIKRAELEVEKNSAAGLCTIITDVRFENEAAWIRANPNAALIYLEVPGLVKDEKYQHASENGISRAESDLVVVNDKSLGLQHLLQTLNELLK